MGLLHELRQLPRETEWVEFKHNNSNPEEIGEYISALANSAAMYGKIKAYLVWGIDNETHELVGTSFKPCHAKKGEEELENWLLRQLEPKVDFRFHSLMVEGKFVVVLEISHAFRHPVRFQNVEYFRVGSYKKKLKDFPEKARQLWRTLDQTPFEEIIAIENVSTEKVLELLDYTSYFELLQCPMPERHETILDALAKDRMVAPSGSGRWNITNLGAVLFARRLTDFGRLHRKVVRVVVYKGEDRIRTEREQEGGKGYAVGFEGLIGFIKALLPMNEIIETAIRKSVPLYPELAIRELIANALIHQDLFSTGNGPMVEIFKSRMEITNPGSPLVDTRRFLDSPPKSRNERLASFMRRVGICEERGSGIDKVVFESELYQLPAPAFEKVGEEYTRAVLFSPQALTRMDQTDRVRACYLHACLKYVSRDFLTNASIRQRFGIERSNIAMASRYIREAVDDQFIRPHDHDAAPKLRKYVPFWA
jgi:predicted HTH transcriptional regulator